MQAAQAAAKWFAASVSAALMAAVALPLTILSATNFIDGAWGIALDRAGQLCTIIPTKNFMNRLL